MPTAIPEIDDMLVFANQRTGRTVEDIKKGVEEHSKKFSGLIASNTRYMTYHYLKTVLQLTPPVLQQHIAGTVITIDEALKTALMDHVSIEGFILRKWTYKNDYSDTNYGFIVKDKSASINAYVTFDDEKKIFEDANLKLGDYVSIQNGKINEYNDSRTFRLGSYGVISKPASPPYKIDDLITPIAKVVNGHSYLIQGGFLNIEENNYVGCPYCTSSFGTKKPKKKKAGEAPKEEEKPKYVYPSGIKEGDHVKCQKCNAEVIAKRLAFTKGLFSDGEDIKVDIAPRTTTSPINTDGIYTLFGKRKEQSDVFSVDEIIASTSNGQAPERFAGELKEAPLEEIIRRIPIYMTSLGAKKTPMDEAKIKELANTYMKASEENVQIAIGQMIQRGILEESTEGKYKVLKLE